MPRVEREVDADAGPVQRFAVELRRLRRAARGPTYRELARRAHYSVATLAQAAAGEKLPSLAVTLAYVRACGGDCPEWEARWRAVADELGRAAAATAPEPDEEPGRIPYLGLGAFQPTDADRFFGRQRLVEDLVARLGRGRFLAVFGASGSGKSSVLRAGLVPAVQSAASVTGARWRTVLLTPGEHPLEECAVRLAELTRTTAGRLHADLTDDPRNLHRIVRQALAGEPPGTELVLVVDQFEEIFTLCADAQERTRFVAALLTTATAADSVGRVVLGVRADFYAHCSEYPELVAALSDAQVLVGPMTTEELRQAITKPANGARPHRGHGPLVAHGSAGHAARRGPALAPGRRVDHVVDRIPR